MSDQLTVAPGPAGKAPGEAAMSSLADRLTALAPAPSLEPVVEPREPEPAQIDGPAAVEETAPPSPPPVRRRRSIVAVLVASFVTACSFIPYALVALALRLVMARLLFLDGQARIEGPSVPLTWHDFGFSVVLPQHIRPETLTGLINQNPPLPLPPALVAYLVCYGEFILPIFLVLGLATRFSALALLIATALIQIYVMPDALWTTHVYWASIALVLLSQGPGRISIDHIIRFFARR